MGPLAELPGLEPDDPEPSAAEHAHHIEFTRRRDWADSELWRAEREAERDRRIAEFRTMRDAWAKRPANDNRPAPSGRFSLTWFGDIAPNAVKRTFIKGVFGEGEFTTISGLPGSGKSAITTDAACHVAAGMPWQGRPVRQGLVVFIAAERKTLTERRMLAFKKRHGVGNIPLLVLGGMIDMTSTNVDARAIAATIKQAEVECGQSCVWIIVDTLTRTFGPGDQNASKDMGRYVQNCDLIRETVGAHLTTIHHTAWTGERGKGAIDLDGAVDASFLVKSKVGSYEFICDGANDGEEGTICKFRMESVVVGTSEDGEPTTAPVIVPDDAKEAAEAFAAAMSGHPGKALEVLRDLTRWGGHVDLDAWRRGFGEVYPGDKAHTVRVRFQRARESLLSSGAVIEREGGYLPADVTGVTDVTCDAVVTCDADDLGNDVTTSRHVTHPLGCDGVTCDEPVKEGDQNDPPKTAVDLDDPDFEPVAFMKRGR